MPPASAFANSNLQGSRIVIPSRGIIGALFCKAGLAFFGNPLLHTVSNRDLSAQLFSIHGVTICVFTGLITVHVGGGLKHLVLDRDVVFGRI